MYQVSMRVTVLVQWQKLGAFREASKRLWVPLVAWATRACSCLVKPALWQTGDVDVSLVFFVRLCVTPASKEPRSQVATSALTCMLGFKCSMWCPASRENPLITYAEVLAHFVHSINVRRPLQG